MASTREPIFNAPGVIVGLIATLAAVHGVRLLLPAALDEAVLGLLAFNPARYAGEADLPGGFWAAPIGILGHMLLHGDMVHLIVNAAWLLGMGTPVARRMPAASFLAFLVLCGMGGALLFMAFHLGRDAAMIGASGAISGAMAAMYRLLFAAEDAEGWRLLRENPRAVPRLSVRGLLSRPQARLAVVIWIVLNTAGALLIGLASGPTIAWEAHLGGFLVGLLALDLFDRGRADDDGGKRGRG